MRLHSRALNSNKKDFDVASDCAITAEAAASNAIIECIDDMCDTPAQRNIACVLITAGMLAKFEGSKQAVGEHFAQQVDEVKAHLDPFAHDLARKVRAQVQSQRSWLDKLLCTAHRHPVMSLLATFGAGALIADTFFMLSRLFG